MRHAMPQSQNPGACRALQRLYLRSACLRDSGVHELVAALQASSVGAKLQVRGREGPAQHASFLTTHANP